MGGSSQLSVLIVEDESSDALLVRAMVGEALTGGEIVVAGRLGEALALVEAGAFDVVVLDLSLPDSVGLGTLHAMRERAPGLPVIVLTGNRDAQLGLLALAAGAQDFLAKHTIDPEILGRSIRFAVQRQRHTARAGGWAALDALTGLPGREFVEHVLQTALSGRSRRGPPVAVVRLDLAGTVVPGVSIDAGMLRSAADRLTGRLRDGDALAHLGGGRFIAVVEGLDTDELASIAERLLDCCRVFETGGRTLHAQPVAGVAVAEAKSSVADLFDGAELAREEAIAQPADWQFADAYRNKWVLERRRAGAELRLALDNDQFLPHYQPIVATRTGEVVAVEALVRWQHPERGLLMPADFLALVEQHGLMVPLGRRILSQACAHRRALRDHGNAVRVCVNLSAPELCADGLVHSVAEALRASGLQHGDLEIELTENVFAEPEPTKRILEGLRAIGVHCSIDDFGTGYSSLAYLTDYPVDAVKIDRSFIGRAGDQPRAAAIVRAMSAMAHELGLTVVAEGVETAEQLALATAYGCDYAQGYHLAPPMDAVACLRWIHAQNTRSNFEDEGARRHAQHRRAGSLP